MGDPMKKFTFVIVSAIATLSIGFTAQSAEADTRLSLSTSSQTVASGTATTVTPSSSVSEASDYNWAQFKFEVIPLDTASYQGSVKFGQLSTTSCSGTVISTSGSTRICSIDLGSRRTILAASSASSSVGASALELKVKTEVSVRFKIRAWLDRDGDNFIDPFEPMSDSLTISVLDFNAAKSMVNWGVNPPNYRESSITTWVSASGAAVKPSGVSGIFNPSFLYVRILHCTSNECIAGRSTGTYVAHPQLTRYEYTVNDNFTVGKWLLVQLVYEPYADSLVIGEKKFDYTESEVANISTELAANNGLDLDQSSVGFGSWHPRSEYAATAAITSFNYQVLVTNKAGKPLANTTAYIFVDLKGVANPSKILADDIPLSSTPLDQVILTRVTDSAGRISVDFSNPTPSASDAIELDVLADGVMASDLTNGSPRAVIDWGRHFVRHVELAFSSATADLDAPLHVVARVTNEHGEPVAGESVTFQTSQPVRISKDSAQLVGGSADFDLTLGSTAGTGGSILLSATVVSTAGQVTSTSRIYWNSVKRVWGTVPGINVPKKASAQIDSIQYRKMGYSRVTAVASNAAGSRVQLIVDGVIKGTVLTDSAKDYIFSYNLKSGQHLVKVLIDGIEEATAKIRVG
jgi:hypothetical protein